MWSRIVIAYPKQTQPMEEKQGNLDDWNDHFKILENGLINQYEEHISFSKRCLVRIEKVVFKYDLPIPEYETALRLIDQYTGIFKKLMSQPIGIYAVDVNKFDSIKATFDERNENLKTTKRLLKSYIKIINGTIKKLEKHHEEENIKGGAIYEIIGFDNSTLNQIMNDDMIDLFLKNELRLKAQGFITSENKWIKGGGRNQTMTRYDLANLILLLQEKKYLKPKFERKHLKDNDYKKFFEVRYGCILKEQFNVSKKDTSRSLETAKITFSYF